MSSWGETIKAAIDEIIANPSKYRHESIEIILDSDRVVAYEGEPGYDDGFYNELMTVKLNENDLARASTIWCG